MLITSHFTLTVPVQVAIIRPGAIVGKMMHQSAAIHTHTPSTGVPLIDARV
jgi:hypothetical protein